MTEIRPRSLPEVTATVCNYNGAAYLPDCIAALRRQTRPLRSIVVYDNASTDGSVALLEQRFPEVRVVEMGANLGPCPARNRGLEEAAEDWVLQVDSDVVLADDCLERLLEDAVSQENTALVMPRALFAGNPERIHYDGGWFHYVGVMTLRHFFAERPKGGEAPLDIDAAIAMALLVRRAPVRSLGGYHPGYFILFEDHDLSYRLRARGLRIRLVPEAIVFHREGTRGISYRQGPSYPRQRAFLHSRNRWMLLLRNHGTAALLLGMPGIVLYEAAWILFATLQGNLPAYLSGKWALLRQLPQLLRQRAELRRRRAVSDRRLLQARPLTHAPMVKRSRLAQGLESLLSSVLAGWWDLVRFLVP